jgi:hypothetical protein
MTHRDARDERHDYLKIQTAKKRAPHLLLLPLHHELIPCGLCHLAIRSLAGT